jgi:hypothetical protein
VRNETEQGLAIRAHDLNGDSVEFLQDVVGPRTEVQIYAFTQWGTPPSAVPSNFFDDFVVVSVGSEPEKVLYEGVRNEDWEQRGSIPESESILTISRGSNDGLGGAGGASTR